MSDKVKNLAPQILDAIKNSNNIFMHCHPSPDPDSVGSVLSMMYALEGMGKNVTAIIGDSDKPQSMAHLPGFDKILDKSWKEISPEDYDLFIAMDSGSKEMISKEVEVVFPSTMKVVVIDHHVSNREYGEINLVDASYPATGQIVYDLLKAWGVEISSDIAACLFLSIYFDTGGFKYSPADENTFKAVAELVRINPHFPKVVFDFENQNYPQKILFQGLALSGVQIFFGGRVAISMVSLEQLRQKGIEPKHTENSEISNTLKSVVGWDIGISFIEQRKDEIYLSFRTRDGQKFDVAKIAVALGGGGHKSAAGASINKPFEDAKRDLLETIQKIYPELGKP